MMLSKSLSRANASSTPRSSASLPGTSIVFRSSTDQNALPTCLFSHLSSLQYGHTAIRSVFLMRYKEFYPLFRFWLGRSGPKRRSTTSLCGKGLCRGCFDTHAPSTLVTRSFHKEVLQCFS